MAKTRLSSPDPIDGGLRAALRKVRWTIPDGQAVLDAHRRSGLSLAEFARRHRLSLHRLYEWRRRLDAGVAPRFLPVTLKTTFPPISPPEAPGMEISLRGGRRVRVGPGFDERLLVRLVEVLEGLPC